MATKINSELWARDYSATTQAVSEAMKLSAERGEAVRIVAREGDEHDAICGELGEASDAPSKGGTYTGEDDEQGRWTVVVEVRS